MTGRPFRGEGEGRRRSSAAGTATRAAHRERPAPGLSELLPPDWAERTYLALDFETTGLDPARCRVVEIGALRFSPGSGLAGSGALASLVNPGMPIPAEVVAIHGIRDADVADSPAFGELASLLLAAAEGAIIVAHNAPFDLSFLRQELTRVGLPGPANAVLDTRLLARAAFPGLPSYRLADLARDFALPEGRAHRALDDARTCAALFLRAASRLAEARVKERDAS